MKRWTCKACGDEVTAQHGYELTAAARHAREVGHPPAGLTVYQQDTAHPSKSPSKKTNRSGKTPTYKLIWLWSLAILAGGFLLSLGDNGKAAHCARSSFPDQSVAVPEGCSKLHYEQWQAVMGNIGEFGLILSFLGLVIGGVLFWWDTSNRHR